jgi:hypothetical protein
VWDRCAGWRESSRSTAPRRRAGVLSPDAPEIPPARAASLRAARLFLELDVLAVGQLRLADFLDDVTQIVGATFGVGATLREIADLANDRRQLAVRAPHRRRRLGRAGEGIEDATLRFGIEQRLRLVLAVQVDELPTDLGEETRVDSRAVDPRPCAPGGHHASTRPSLLRHRCRARRGARESRTATRLRRLDRGALGPGARHRRGAFAEQQSECADDDRLPGARLAGQHVEAARERDERLDDREILIRSSVSI